MDNANQFKGVVIQILEVLVLVPLLEYAMLVDTRRWFERWLDDASVMVSGCGRGLGGGCRWVGGYVCVGAGAEASPFFPPQATLFGGVAVSRLERVHRFCEFHRRAKH